ncbi:hypothetical protein BDY19DRAFT_884425 [Irpex rosettiformis]|uniref:Uncharacterized protein n=1 Tax=Irpex rosettiformis TaxID=378272 RepID=A0ACB8UD78_9APHY|nr:hypothetical protein BDY19DRAFT_884425 [Irpex rosettiformis]
MLPFVPRKVARTLRSQKIGASTSSSSASAQESKKPIPLVAPEARQDVPNTNLGAQSDPKGEPQAQWKGKGRERSGFAGTLQGEHYVALLRLAVSEHALWSDPDLRRNLEHSDDGFIPLTYLTDISPCFPSTPETVIVKALRTHGNDTFDVRLLMSSPSRAEWYGKAASAKSLSGGYEVRLKNWKETLERSRNGSRNEWESRTVYVENIPASHRSPVGIFYLISALIPSDPSTNLRVQSISLPKHHLDKPSDAPKCKGFALVTLLHDKDVALLLQRWPWKRTSKMPKEDQNPFVQEAAKSGLRSLSKSRWGTLNSEYLQYRQRILDDTAKHERSQAPLPAATDFLSVEEEVIDNAELVEEEAEPVSSVLDYNAPYPPGCLVHVRHVHPETNKTTLRKLFANASSEDNAGIDYVDFNKGMDTCYLRLATPKHTERLVTRFHNSPVIQTTGLDDTGSSQFTGGKAITVEIVEGTREELYWLKIPEKLRRQAVEKAILGDKLTNGTVLKRPALGDTIALDGHKPKRRRR